MGIVSTSDCWMAHWWWGGQFAEMSFSEKGKTVEEVTDCRVRLGHYCFFFTIGPNMLCIIIYICSQSCTTTVSHLLPLWLI
jgi:hypothetical protein